MPKPISKEPIIESFRRWLDDGVCSFNEAEVKIMLDRITYLEDMVDELKWDVMQAAMGEDF